MIFNGIRQETYIPGMRPAPVTGAPSGTLTVRYVRGSSGLVQATFGVLKLGFRATWQTACADKAAPSGVEAVLLRNVTVRDNVATAFGGGFFGINAEGFTDVRSLTLNLTGWSSFAGNAAAAAGGAIFASNALVVADAGTAFSGNIAAGGPGGAVRLEGVIGGLRVTGGSFSGNWGRVRAHPIQQPAHQSARSD